MPAQLDVSDGSSVLYIPCQTTYMEALRFLMHGRNKPPPREIYNVRPGCYFAENSSKDINLSQEVMAPVARVYILIIHASDILFLFRHHHTMITPMSHPNPQSCSAGRISSVTVPLFLLFAFRLSCLCRLCSIYVTPFILFEFLQSVTSGSHHALSYHTISLACLD